MSTSQYFFGNWKMAQSLSGLQKFFVQWQVSISPNSEILVFPSSIHLSLALEASRSSSSKIQIGAQDLSTEAQGAFTGEISAAQIFEIGVRTVLIGHSERRQRSGETLQTLKAKLQRAHEGQLRVVFCVGETAAQRDSGEVMATLNEQLKALEGHSFGVGQLIVAYEPVWAIGTGRVARLEEIEEVHRHLSAQLPKIPLLYGGSVKPDNAAEILRVGGVSGLLVGGASLSANDFKKIVESGYKNGQSL